MPQSVLPLDRPQSIGEVLDVGFRLFKTSFLVCMPLAILVVIIGQIPTAYNIATHGMAGLDRMGPVWWVLTILATLVSVILAGAIILRQWALAHGESNGWGDYASTCLRRLPAMLLVYLVYILAFIVGLILLIVPGVWVGLALLFAFPALLIDRLSVGEALRTSIRLVKNNWWRSAAVMTVALFALIAIYALAGFLAALLGQVVSRDGVVTMAVTTIVLACMSGLLMPFSSALMIALFADLKLRKAGGDIERRIGELRPS